MSDDLVVFENRHSHFDEFLKLNQQWIETYFSLEQCDLDLARNISHRAESGDLFFSVTERKEGGQNNPVIGACALFRSQKRPQDLELARMAVDTNYRGRGIATFLMNHALEKATQLKAERIYLMTNTVLETAVAMYRKWGFTDCLVGPSPEYGRCNLVMEKWLNP